MQVLDFLALFVLFLQVAQVAINLVLSLGHAVLDLSYLLSPFILVLLFNFGKSFMMIFLRACCNNHRLAIFLGNVTLRLDIHGLVNVGKEFHLFIFLLLLALTDRHFTDALSMTSSQLLFPSQLSFFVCNFAIDCYLSALKVSYDISFFVELSLHSSFSLHRKLLTVLFFFLLSISNPLLIAFSFPFFEFVKPSFLLDLSLAVLEGDLLRLCGSLFKIIFHLASFFIFLSLEYSVFGFPEDIDRLLFLSLLVMDQFLPFLLLFHILHAVLGHFLLELGFIILLGHSAVQDKFLVERVSKHDFRRQCGLGLIHSVVMDEVHGNFAKGSAWRYGRTKQLCGATLRASSTIHCRWLLHSWELLSDILNHAAAKGILYLLGEYSAFIFMVLKAHRSDLFRDTWLKEVLECPIKR